MSIVVRVLHALMVPLFGLCVAVQYNDPDGLQWMMIYASALLLALFGAFGAPPRWPAAVVATFAFLYACVQAPSFQTCITVKDACFSSFQMHNDLVAEEAREVGGLLIVVGWSLVTIMDANARLRRSTRRGA